MDDEAVRALSYEEEQEQHLSCAKQDDQAGNLPFAYILELALFFPLLVQSPSLYSLRFPIKIVRSPYQPFATS